jgi:hypothetical protein
MLPAVVRCCTAAMLLLFAATPCRGAINDALRNVCSRAPALSQHLQHAMQHVHTQGDADAVCCSQQQPHPQQRKNHPVIAFVGAQPESSYLACSVTDKQHSNDSNSAPSSLAVHALLDGFARKCV